MTDWFFTFDIGSDNPTTTYFKTNKSIKEISFKFGGDNVYILNDDGRLILTLWYFDEYTDQNLGFEIADRIAYWKIFDKVENIDNINIVDLDVIFEKRPVKNLQYNFFELWNKEYNS